MIPIRSPGGAFIPQKVLYEWKMMKCTGCGFLGHEVQNCRRKKSQTQQSIAVNEAATKHDTVGKALVTEPPSLVAANEGKKPGNEGKEKAATPSQTTPNHGKKIDKRHVLKGAGQVQRSFSDSVNDPQYDDGFTQVIRKSNQKKNQSNVTNQRSHGRGGNPRGPNG